MDAAIKVLKDAVDPKDQVEAVHSSEQIYPRCVPEVGAVLTGTRPAG